MPTSNSNFNTTTYSMSFNGEIVAGWAIFFLVVATILASISLYRFVRPAAVRPPAPPLSADPSYPYQMPYQPQAPMPYPYQMPQGPSSPWTPPSGPIGPIQH